MDGEKLVPVRQQGSLNPTAHEHNPSAIPDLLLGPIPRSSVLFWRSRSSSASLSLTIHVPLIPRVLFARQRKL